MSRCVVAAACVIARCSDDVICCCDGCCVVVVLADASAAALAAASQWKLFLQLLQLPATAVWAVQSVAKVTLAPDLLLSGLCSWQPRSRRLWHGPSRSLQPPPQQCRRGRCRILLVPRLLRRCLCCCVGPHCLPRPSPCSFCVLQQAASGVVAAGVVVVTTAVVDYYLLSQPAVSLPVFLQLSKALHGCCHGVLSSAST